MVNNPYSKMQDDVIFAATKEELTLMLYEGGIKFLNRAIAAIEKNEIEKAHNAIVKTQDIVREFQITLDFQYEIANQLNALYDYMHRRLVHANMQKDIEALNEVLGMFRDFRDTWKEAMKIARN